MAYYVVGPDGAESGPFELDVLIEWAKAGTLPSSAPIRDVPGGRGVPASELVELAPYLSQFSQAPGHVIPTGNAMIPSGNPHALWSYYLGWLSLLCLIGLPLAPFAILKGRKGLKAYEANPAIYGKVHAIIGIVFGSLSVVGNAVLVVVIVKGMNS